MKARRLDRFPVIAALKAQTSPWLGFEVQFKENLRRGTLSESKPLIEELLNEHLQKMVDTDANNLVIPFNCKLVAGRGKGLYQFRVKVYRQSSSGTLPFSYPPETVLALNNFAILDTTVPTPSHLPIKSQTTSVALTPPPL